MNEVRAEKVALVTGGSSGIGKATAIAFSEAGWSVAVADVNEELGAQSRRKLRRAARRPCSFAATSPTPIR